MDVLEARLIDAGLPGFPDGVREGLGGGAVVFQAGGGTIVRATSKGFSSKLSRNY